ncbi:MAG: hypothetical protein HYV97_09050 [Bdellovibrio sp.]|nr:hypothetical protein [Bdellovibrio sp.]
MNTKCDLLKFFTLLFLFFLIPASYGQRGNIAGRSKTDAVAAAHNQTMPAGDKMTRIQLEQSCINGNPSLASTAFLTTASYNNYLTICSEVKARLSPPTKGKDIQHAGAAISALAQEMGNQQQAQDNTPAKGKAAGNAALDTLRPSTVANLRNENANINRPTSNNTPGGLGRTAARTATISERAVINNAGRTNANGNNVHDRARDAARDVIRERTVDNSNHANTLRPAARSTSANVPRASLTGKTSTQVSDQFQRPNRASNIFTARQDRINARQEIVRTEEVPTKKTLRDVTNAPRPTTPDQGASNSVSSALGGASDMTPGTSVAMTLIQQHEQDFEKSCNDLFNGKQVVSLDPNNKSLSGEDCCKVLYRKILTDMRQTSPSQIQNQPQLFSAFAAVSTLGPSRARGKLSNLTQKKLIPPKSRNLFKPLNQARLSPMEKAPPIPGKISNIKNTSASNPDPEVIAAYKNNIEVIKNYIKIADAFLDSEESHSLKQQLLNAINNNNYGEASATISTIEMKANTNLNAVEPIYINRNSQTQTATTIANASGSRSGRTKKTESEADKFKNKLAELQKTCQQYNFTIVASKEVHSGSQGN